MIIQFEMGEEEPHQNSSAYSIVDAGLQHRFTRYHNVVISRMDFYGLAPTTYIMQKL